MVEQNENIQELKETVSFILDAVEASERVYEDKKIEREEVFAEGMQLALKIGKVKNVKKAYQQIPILKNPLKRQELVEFVKNDFDLKNDNIEELVEGTLELIKKAFDLVDIYKAVRIS